MMTAYTTDQKVQQARAEGACGILFKPLDIEKMVALIERTRIASEGSLILVVDDVPGTSIIFKNTLVTKGYNVEVAYSKEQALARAQQKANDIIFIDMQDASPSGGQKQEKTFMVRVTVDQ